MDLRSYGGEACLRTGDARKPTIITGIRRWTSAAMAQYDKCWLLGKIRYTAAMLVMVSWQNNREIHLWACMIVWFPCHVPCMDDADMSYGLRILLYRRECSFPHSYRGLVGLNASTILLYIRYSYKWRTMPSNTLCCLLWPFDENASAGASVLPSVTKSKTAVHLMDCEKGKQQAKRSASCNTAWEQLNWKRIISSIRI